MTAWAALGEMMGADYEESDLPSDTTVVVGRVYQHASESSDRRMQEKTRCTETCIR